jgi:rieske iron-sulfur protein
VFGPAPHRLAALPLAIVDGSLTVAAPFIGKVGAQQAG